MNPKFGLVRVAAISPKVAIANPKANVDTILSILAEQEVADCDIVVFPENFISGYTCGDLFAQKKLLDEVVDKLIWLQRNVGHQLVIVGAPLMVNNVIYNCAIAINNKEFIGVVPKQHLPNYREFYESRWFRAGSASDPTHINIGTNASGIVLNVPFGIDLIYRNFDLLVAGEICEDLFMATPPTSDSAVAGATILYNCSASPEQVAKAAYRTELVKNQSGRCMAAYVYTSSGPSESTSDLVFGGHCLIAENGNLLEQSRRVGDIGNTEAVFNRTWCISDIDHHKLLNDRRNTTSFFNVTPARKYRIIPFHLKTIYDKPPKRYVSAAPFVPNREYELRERCSEVFGIQTMGLRKRLGQLPLDTPISIGVSGGLDSTLALLAVLSNTCHQQFGTRTRLKALTMPGFGTTDQTKGNAYRLAKELGIVLTEIDIRPASIQTFLDLNHRPFGIDCYKLNHPPVDSGVSPMEKFEIALRNIPVEDRKDVVFENIQARHRTNLLMNSGFVIGTGDMSEAALGWCTYNGDHMSMYNPNCSIPKTLVRFLVRFIAENTDLLGSINRGLKDVLLDIADTVISPELLPRSNDGQIEQSTEDVIGPYELHDFFLFHFIRNGFPPEKILYLAKYAVGFSKVYSEEEIKKHLATFYKRFFFNQFKRNCIPDGPKVGSVSLSPRGDWRMPSDADPTAWLESIR